MLSLKVKDSIFSWYHRVNGYELSPEETPGNSAGQRSLAWYSPGGCKMPDMTESGMNTVGMGFSEI